MASSAGLQALSPFEMYVLAPQQVPVVSPFKDGGCPTSVPPCRPILATGWDWALI